MPRGYLRKEGQANYTASTQSRIELSKNYHIRYLVCALTINHDNNLTASFNSENFANLINSIQIVANGNKTIKHVNVRKLIYNALYEKGRQMVNTVVTASGTSKESTIYFTVDFAMRGMVRPMDTIENAALYNTFDMMVDWANAAACGTGITVNSAVLTVSSRQLVGYNRNKNERISHNIETQLTEEITSTTSEFQISLPVKKVYRQLLVAANVDGVRNNSVINAIKLKSGTTVFAEWTAADMRADNIDRHGIETASSADGLLLLDLAGRGRMSDALDTRNEFNTLELVLDVTKQTGTNTVTVYSDVFDVEEAVEVKG